MREERTRRDRRLATDERSGAGARRLTLVLGFVALVMVGLVIYRYWPAWVADWGSGFLADAGARVESVWTEIGGRWLTLGGVVVAVILATILARSHRTLAIVLVELAVAVGAVLVLVQPAGW